MIFSEGSGLNGSVFGESQDPIRMFLEARGEAFEQKSMIKSIFQMGKSSHYGEKMTAMTGMDDFQAVGEGGGYPEVGMQESYSKTLEHMTWKSKFVVTQEMVEDGKLIDFKKKPQAFINSYYRTREKFAAAIVGGAIGGNTSMSFKGKAFDISSADQVCLFSASHPAKVTGSLQSNRFADSFSETALSQMETTMQCYEGDNDELLEVSPDTILIPNLYSLKKDVFAAIGADKDPATANNGFNFQYGRWTVGIWGYLNQFITSGTAPWIMLDSKYNEEHGGLVWLDRVELSVRSDIDANTDDNVWKGRARFIGGANDWRALCVGGISGAGNLS